MHNNFYFLRQLSSVLQQVLTGTVISECYSQSKDEVILRFETHAKSFYIKASLSAALSALSFPTTVERAKKNSVDLFPAIIGYRVLDVRQYENERSFSLVIENGKIFLLKMHGNRSNAVLYENHNVAELFRKNLVGDEALDLHTMDRPVNWTFENFLDHQQNPEKVFFTFGKVVWLYLKDNGYEALSVNEKWNQIQDVISKLERPSYYITNIKSSPHLTLLPFAESKPIKGDALFAANEFFYSFTQVHVLEKEKSAVVASLKNKINSGLSYYEKNFQKLAEIERDTNYKSWADLIMANMHQIKQGMEKVSLPDFYSENKAVEIKLKKEFSPQSNAAVYYRKAKNQHIEIERLQQSLLLKEKEIEQSRKQIEEISNISDLKPLRKRIQELGLHVSQDKQQQALPFHEFEMNGFRIWVGKNAEGNDELTLRYAYKEDLWLHAKDVAGSHVIIKHQSGKKFPKDVIERAAQLAAYNSKRKTESLCPVIVTPKKYVRKRKGDPAGAVVVEREEVILVEPKLD